MITRARQRALSQRNLQHPEEKEVMTEEEEFDRTLVQDQQVEVGDDMNILHSASHSTAGSVNEQLALIIQGISALRSTVDTIQRESGANKNAITVLREHIDRQASCSMQQSICSTSVPCDTATIHTAHINSFETTHQNLTSTNQVPTNMPQSTPTLHMSATQYFQPNNSTRSENLSSPTLHNMTSHTVDHIVKLYPLPVFNGKAEDWPLFLANFNDTTREFGYNNKQNLMRLQKALQGEARLAVQSLLIHPNDVPKVIDELQFNFGRLDILVRSQISQVQQIPVIYENNLEAIIVLSNRVRNMVALFKSSNCTQHLMNTTLLEQLVTKLPRSKQYEWVKYAANIQPFATVENFAIWISDIARVICLMPVTTTVSGRQSANSSAVVTPGSRQTGQTGHRRSTSSEVKRVFQTSDSTEQPQPLCAQCKRSHHIKDCPDFKALTVDERWQLVKCQRLCISCLRRGHIILNCRKKKACGIDGCNRPHHNLLHQHSTPDVASEGSSTQHVYNCRQNEPHKQLFRILPVTLTGPYGSQSVFAMLDEGSSVTLLEEETAKRLGLKGQAKPLTLQWYDDQLRTENSRIVTVNISGVGKYCSTYTLKNVRTLKELNLPRQSFHKDWCPNLMSLPISNHDDVKPVMLIGLDNCHLGVPNEVVEGVLHKLVATKTKLGWVAFGPLDDAADVSPRVLHVRESTTMRHIARLVDDYFSTENFGVRANEVVLESDDTTRAKKILSDTTQKTGLRYETGLLWREDNIKMPESYKMARDRLCKVENRMALDSKYAELYKKMIDKYIAKGYAKLLSPEEVTSESKIIWYLPHFGVFNPNKPHKIRVVFDAAANSNNISLNSMLLKGPEHAQPLFKIMFKFRQGTVAVAGDIEEMFSQVKIQAKDQHAQRFLWRDGDRTAPIKVYTMTSMIFGAICSPCSAEYIKNINASSHMSSMPRGARAVIENTYVDDFVMSFFNEQDAFNVTADAFKINATARFKLRRFVLNCQALEKKFNTDQTTDVSILPMTHQVQTDKVLGLFWDKIEDAFRFQFKFNKIPQDVLQNIRPPTKREMLGIVLAVYDPFGFLSNFTIFMKLLLQSTWKRRLGCEEPLPHQLFLLWSEWWVEFQKVNQFSVPRCYTPLLNEAEDVQLHIFVDASASAVAAVTYLRVQKNSLVHVVFVAAKTRAAPIKELSTPRLELQAAVLSAV